MAYLSCVSQTFRTNSVPDILSIAGEPGAGAPINWSVEWLEPYTPPRFQTHQVPSSETLSPVWEAVWKGNLRVCSRRLRSPQPRQVAPNVAVYCASARLHQKSARKSCLIHSRVRMRPRVCAGESGRQSCAEECQTTRRVRPNRPDTVSAPSALRERFPGPYPRPRHGCADGRERSRTGHHHVFQPSGRHQGALHRSQSVGFRVYPGLSPPYALSSRNHHNGYVRIWWRLRQTGMEGAESAVLSTFTEEARTCSVYCRFYLL